MITKQTTTRRGRPPKIARDSQDTKAELLRSGLELLTKQGFTSSGIDSILKKVGVPKGSFYHYFDSKEAFGREVINNYASYFEKKLNTHLLNTAYKPLERLANFVNDAKLGMAQYQFERGCLIGNLEQEVTLLPVSFRTQLAAVLSDWQSQVATCLEEALNNGDICKTANCTVLSELFWIGWEGAVSRARLVQDTKPLDIFFNHFINSLSK
ncbi:TetR/AcrR family transcriptional regulator [Litorilituus lipolyticus]|uniref:TetR family transcriptional regulator n=1 Tax=Litorilituus lipolyticus TaxID=2491017 RepID=A0A502KQ75_9GAMM|nr:TetR/AcrR family transcriptional regulator [Litorilituus lipolyticus]TPH12151.1 TetR family transcriptional regulator [Litorilituus lipolyticus]